ncbi:hypothetical protein QTP70_030930 [Hemibagrus guttatus]|uniref:Uncharacterized protein n=1 Tax=Hemibagrus guttatus TaxID=175788 RepID=A0AAE0QM11_9TELE|nr:hypothetical protein QTP70_030930 [Hemibagrus guttatus]
METIRYQSLHSEEDEGAGIKQFSSYIWFSRLLHVPALVPLHSVCHFSVPLAPLSARRHWASRQDTHWTECQPITGHTHSLSLSFTHAITHGQFRDANQPTMHVFGLGEETGVPGGNPRGTGRTCKLHTRMAEVGMREGDMK